MSELAERYDVVCIGGAMMGSATAYFLTENPDFDGSVLVVEPDWTYESAQTTRAQNSIREQFTNELNIRLSSFGVDFIARFHENVQVEGEAPEINFRGTGYLFLADTDELYARLEQESHAQLAAGAEVEMLRPADVATRFPYMDPDQLVGARLGGMREGSFDGWALFRGLRQRAIHNGANYIRDRVAGLDVVHGRVSRVRLESGRSVACDHGRVSGEAGRGDGGRRPSGRAQGSDEFRVRLSNAHRAHGAAHHHAGRRPLPSGATALHVWCCAGRRRGGRL
jgi:glycine/D-amino acid oxidase-like deaminating enzyme